jgi:hypothetical protein
MVSETGTGEGSVISPLLANVYLHYVFDLWAKRWRRREATGDMIVVRYADDIIAGFEHETDANRFRDAMRARLQEFSLSLHPEQTRLIEFGRHAAAGRARRGLGKPETFTFLGFTFVCGKSRRGRFLVERKTRRDRMRAKLRELKVEMRRRRHQPIPEQGKWLRQVVTGFFAYHAVRTNCRSLGAFRYHVTNLWRRTLRPTQPKGSDDVGAGDEARRRLAPATARPPPLAEPALRRSSTRGRSRMRECRTSGSVRGALSNERPYPDCGSRVGSG